MNNAPTSCSRMQSDRAGRESAATSPKPVLVSTVKSLGSPSTHRAVSERWTVPPRREVVKSHPEEEISPKRGINRAATGLRRDASHRPALG